MDRVSEGGIGVRPERECSATKSRVCFKSVRHTKIEEKVCCVVLCLEVRQNRIEKEAVVVKQFIHADDSGWLLLQLQTALK